ncbi:MAG: YraN family protein [Clostridia bacterium]
MRINPKDYENLGRQFDTLKGQVGEQYACDYLIKKGYKILTRNYKCPIGEIDIIAQDKKTIVFVEVKYRKTAYFGLPQEAVTPYKQNKIRAIAQTYLKMERKLNNLCRFDVIGVLGDEITHIENAF